MKKSLSLVKQNHCAARAAGAAALIALGGSMANGEAKAKAKATSCGSLAALALPHANVTSAQFYGADDFKMPSNGGPPRAGGGAPGRATFGAPGGGAQTSGPVPAFCRVEVTSAPSRDSDIKIEVWLPASGWNGKFVGIGNMGWGGDIPYGNMLAPLQKGYAVAGTDTGHRGNSGAFLIGHPEKMIDYSYRADHEMTLKAKAVIKAFFGQAAKLSYWVGCSLGGQEALMEAYRYPADYDGIVAGAPVNPLSRLNAAQLWPAWLNVKYPHEAIPAAKFIMINAAVLKQCASVVGQAQGFVDDPSSCHFEPASLQCKGGDQPNCLTAPQVDMLRRYYQGPVNPRTGESIFPGMPYGGELQWARDQGGAKPIGVAVDLYKYAVYQNPNWDWKTMDYDTAVTKAVKEVDPLLYAKPDLTAFFNHGGKIMLYVGWAEYHSATDMTAYYKAVLKNAPGDQNSIRLFEVPGMGHCAGGTGCDTFEKLGTVDQWVETGSAPDVLMSSKQQGGETIRTRPLCAYPRTAKYRGTGSFDEASSFTCT